MVFGQGFRSCLLAGVGIALLAGPACAGPAEAVAPAGGDLSEIIVTAQRRSDRLIDVPATVAVASAERLDTAQVVDILDIPTVLPGITWVAVGFAAAPTVRGIGSTVRSVSNSGNVGIYVDGYYQEGVLGSYGDLNDVDRVEALKGPQGTLYGRNATAGAILITTLAPSFDFQGKGVFSYSSFNTRRVKGFVTGPLTSTLAASLSAAYSESDGYFKNVFLNNKADRSERESIRGKILYKPRDRLSFTLAGSHSFLNDPTTQNNAPYNNRNSRRSLPGYVAVSGYQIAYNFNSISKLTVNDATLTGEYMLDGATLTSYSGYREVMGFTVIDSDITSIPTFPTYMQSTREVSASQEFVLASSSDGPLKWLSGLSYSRNRSYVRNPGLFISGKAVSNAYSGFLEGTYTWEKLSVTGGARYIKESRRTSGLSSVPGAFNLVRGAKKWDAWTPRVTALYRLADDQNVYASYGVGWKSGGFNLQSLVGTPFDPERVTGWEIGYKGRPDPRVSVEAAIFRYNYKDIQTQASLIDPNTGLPNRPSIVNAATARTRGAEVTLGLFPLPNLNVQAGLTYTDAKYTRFPNAILAVPLPSGGNLQPVGSATGNRLIGAPKWAISIGGNYKYDMDFAELDVGGNLYRVSGVHFDAANRLRQGVVTQVSGQAGLTPAGTNIRISVWGKNLLDEFYPGGMLDQAVGDRANYAEPRSVGVQLDVKF